MIVLFNTRLWGEGAKLLGQVKKFLLILKEELGVEFLRHAGVGIGGVLLDDLPDEGAVMGGFGKGSSSTTWG